MCGAASVPAAPPADTVRPVELPAFQPGLWEYHRALRNSARTAPQTMTVKKCSDPSRDIKQKLQMLKQQGCRFSPLRQSGNRYQSSWVCPRGEAVITFQDTLTVTGPAGYEDSSEVHQGSGHQVTRSSIVAKRLGDCEPGSQSSPAVQPAATARSSR
jgi:hypothetical protein